MAEIGVKVRQSGSIMSLKRCRDAAELRKSFEFVEFLSFYWEERAFVVGVCSLSRVSLN